MQLTRAQPCAPPGRRAPQAPGPRGETYRAPPSPNPRPPARSAAQWVETLSSLPRSASQHGSDRRCRVT